MTITERLRMMEEQEERNQKRVEDWMALRRERKMDKTIEEEITMENTVIRQASWSNIGRDVVGCRDMESVLRTSGLDYDVVKRPVFYGNSWEDETGTIEIPNRFVTVRERDGHPYDVVSDKFEIIQNRDAFDFVNYMGDEVEFVKAGETATGVVYIIGKLPDVNILGDAFTPYVLFRNGFNGKTKITAAISPLRIVCQNQFNISFKKTSNTVTIRHVRNAEAKLMEARETLKMCHEYMDELSAMASSFAGMRLTKERTERIIDLMFPRPDASMNPFKRKTMEDARTAFLQAHEQGDNSNFRGTAWGLINAYTDYITHKEPAGNREDRFEGKFINTTFKVSMNPVIDAIEAAK